MLLGRRALTNLDSVLKNTDITLLITVCIVKAIVFPVVMYRFELDHKEGWALRNWCFQTVVLEKTLLRAPWDTKEIKSVNPKENEPWIFIGRTDTEAKAPILWPPDGNNWLIGKDPDAGKEWGLQEKGETGMEIVGWHHHSMDMSLRKFGDIVKGRNAWHANLHGVAKSQTWLSKNNNTQKQFG